MTTIELSNETEQRLAQLAVRSGTTTAALLNDFIEQGIADMEAGYHALAVLERVHTGQEPIYSTAAVRTALELDC